MKKIFSYITLIFIIWISNFFVVNTFAADHIFWDNVTQPYCSEGSKCWLEEWIEEIKWKVEWIKTEWTAVDYVQWVVSYILTFLFAITVILIMWAWFMILTAAGDSDKIDKAKKIITNCIIGLMVIFLAYAITSFIVDIFTKV